MHLLRPATFVKHNSNDSSFPTIRQYLRWVRNIGQAVELYSTYNGAETALRGALSVLMLQTENPGAGRGWMEIMR